MVTLRSDNENSRIEKLFDADTKIKIIEVENMYQCIALIRNESVKRLIGQEVGD